MPATALCPATEQANLKQQVHPNDKKNKQKNRFTLKHADGFALNISVSEISASTQIQHRLMEFVVLAALRIYI